VAVGAKDSPQATLIPLAHLAGAGLKPGADFEVLPFDKLLGKHGDHIGGERDAARALMRGEADAACMIDANHLAFIREGTLTSIGTRILSRTPAYDHCNFTVLDDAPSELVARFRELMLAMSYADAEVRPLLDLEGLKQWLPGRTEGYRLLAAAVERCGK
jgi:ABC-type phosphate/phosphonate transport system substrate-binding protein